MIENFEKDFKNYILNSEHNYIKKEYALAEEYIGIKMFDEPIFAYGDAADALFAGLKDRNIIGEHFKMPHEWNDKARTIVSIFLPFTEEVIKSNCEIFDYPSDLWLHGRIEGQSCICDYAKFGEKYLEELGYKTISPTISQDFFSVTMGDDLSFTSNWSERHVAFICGLGTFGLSKGIITEKGMAGRLVSFITQAQFDITERRYTEVYEHCTMCGACVKRCPAQAITIENGKNHITCSTFLNTIKIKAKPRFGCGKCQVNVPCMRKNPTRKRGVV